MTPQAWAIDAAARRRIPLVEALNPPLMHYPTPTRWARCGSCRSTVWSLGRCHNEAADAMAVHAAFCGGGR